MSGPGDQSIARFTHKITVVLVDDHAIVRLGLRTLINDQPDIEVVGEASTAGEALHVIAQYQPQVVLMDIRLPGTGGMEATREISKRYPKVKVVMLTSYVDEELVVSAIRAGAVGYLLKEVGNEEVLHGIRLAAEGKSVMDADTTRRLFTRLRISESQEQEDAFRLLSERELEVLYEVSQGKTNAEIADTLHLSEKTARNYVSSLLEKLDLTNRIELATYAVKHHLSERMKKCD